MNRFLFACFAVLLLTPPLSAQDSSRLPVDSADLISKFGAEKRDQVIGLLRQHLTEESTVGRLEPALALRARIERLLNPIPEGARKWPTKLKPERTAAISLDVLTNADIQFSKNSVW